MSYLLVSYKPSSDDYCRGCHMASYDSKHRCEQYDSIEEIIEEVAILSATVLRPGEEAWDYEVFYAHNNKIRELSLWSDESWATQLSARIDEIDEARVLAEKAEALALAEKRNRQQEAEERKQLAMLQEKYNAGRQ